LEYRMYIVKSVITLTSNLQTNINFGMSLKIRGVHVFI